MEIFLMAAIVGGLAGGLAVLGIAFLIPRKRCPKCNLLLPRFRRPANSQQAIRGGWDCPGCGAKIARNGTLLPG